MEGFYILLKNVLNPDKYINKLITRKWITRPGLSLYSINSRKDTFYVLLNELGDLIGFMVMFDKKIEYFELLEEYRLKGYGASIIRKINPIEALEVSYSAEGFWDKMNVPY